jgi:hypothetical protein
LLIAAGIILAIGIFILYRNKQERIENAASVLRFSNPTAPEPKEQEESPQPEVPVAEESPMHDIEAPQFTTFQKQSGLGMDLLRALLIALCLAVAGALVLVFLPQSSIATIAQHLESRHRTSQPEKIAFLYVGDKIIDNQFHIRGVVRNITASPIEQLDAIVRFYAQDRSLLETTIVRMNRETIGPNEIAQFELIYPNDWPGFAGYSTEFKLRQGATVPYKDLRKLPVQAK